MDKIGVPRNSKWRALILYMRSIKDFDFISDSQKEEVQMLVVEILKDRDFSDAKFNQIIQHMQIILNEPCNKRLKDLFKQTAELIDEFKHMLSDRRGELQSLGQDTVGRVSSGRDMNDIITEIKSGFRTLIDSMDKDARNLSKLANTDALTRLNNRKAFNEAVEDAVEKALQENAALSLLMLDIDHFKDFNDTFGHLVGDKALSAVASLIREYADEANRRKGRNYFPARFGGEEFVIILPRVDRYEAEMIAEELRQTIEAYDFVIRDVEGHVIKSDAKITVSVGVGEFSPDWKIAKIDSLIDAADKALYRAKRTGRNRVCVQCAPAYSQNKLQ